MQYEDSRIRNARYNKRYKYLKREKKGSKYIKKGTEVG